MNIVPNLGYGDVSGMVQHQIGLQSYEVVRTIHDNLVWLHQLYGALPNMVRTEQVIPHLNLIASSQWAIEAVANNLHMLSNMNSQLPLVQEVLPQLVQLKDELTRVNTIATTQHTQTEEILSGLKTIRKIIRDTELAAKQQLDDLYAHYVRDFDARIQKGLCELNQTKELIKQDLLKVEQHLPQLLGLINDMPELKKTMAALKASDYTEKAMFTQQEVDRETARKAIRESEKLGNYEAVNKSRLNMRNKDLNLFKQLNERNLELAHKNQEGLFKPEVKCETN